MLSKPSFEVDLIKPGGKTLSFTCNYVHPDQVPEGQEEGMDDVFSIDEVTMFEDEDTKRVQKALRLKFENALLW